MVTLHNYSEPEESGSIPSMGKAFLLHPVWPTQPPTQSVLRDPYPGGKARPGRDADHSLPSGDEIKNE
jgi:hypothetical protein